MEISKYLGNKIINQFDLFIIISFVAASATNLDKAIGDSAGPVFSLSYKILQASPIDNKNFPVQHTTFFLS